MSVTINIPPFFQHLAGEQKAARVSGSTVGECLTSLVRKYPKIGPELFAKKGKLHHNLEVFVNRQTSYPEELAKSVNDNDEISIVNIILGG